MDLYGRFWAEDHTPERIAARKRRQAAKRATYEGLREALGTTRTALAWSQQQRSTMNTPIGQQHPGAAALLAVRRVLSQFDTPTEIQLRWAGMKRSSGQGAYRMRDGVVVVEATLRSLTGVQRAVDIPVQVRDGYIFDPSVLIDRGSVRVLAQHTLDDLYEQGTLYQETPSRVTMYSPPAEHATVQVAPLVRPGMFGVAPVNRMLTRAYVQGALRGVVPRDLPEFSVAQHIARDHLDVAERSVADLQQGDEVKLTDDVDLVMRDGMRIVLMKGTEGRIVRDVDGSGRRYYVQFVEENCTAPVDGEHLKRV